MSQAYDVVVVGSGHNGLTTAAYLAKAGMSVLVLERNDWYGGGVVTHEILAPGFKFDLHSSLHSTILANPIIAQDELGLLSKYGLEYLYPDAMFSTIFEDGSSIITYRDVEKSCESIARISPRDAEAYRRFAHMSMKIVPMMTHGLFAPAPQQGTFYALLDQSQEGQDIFRALQMSKLDICKEWFENEKVMIHLLRFSVETQTAPEDMGTGFILHAMAGMTHTYGIGIPVGGSGALVDSLIRCLEAHGAEFRKEADVKKVLVSGGRATGVRLASGEVINAKVAVIAQIHPWLIGDEVENVDAGVVQRAKRVRTAKISLMEQHIALNEPPKYKAGYEAGNVVLAGFAPPTMERFLRVFDHYKYGDMWSEDSNDTIMAARMHGQFDPTQCPPGKCALTFYAFGPFDMRGGAEKWDEYQWKVADRLLEHYRTFTTNMTDENIIGRRFDTPLELSRHSSMFQKGDVNGAGEYLFQMGGHRPNPELAKLKIPGIENLYLSGAAINVSSVSGGGRATAIKACQDLKIDFDRLIG